jgi:hypothetical protein
MDKVSKKVNSLLASQSEGEEVRLQILLQREADPKAVRALATDLEEYSQESGHVRFIPAAGMLMCTVPLASVEAISRRPEVQWVDTVSRAPLESLLDG